MSVRADILAPLIIRANRLAGKELESKAATEQALQMADDLGEIPTPWLAKSYEYARIHRKPVPMAMDVVRAWDHDIKADAQIKHVKLEPVAKLAEPVEDEWATLAAYRICRSSIPYPSKWVLDMAGKPPMLQEVCAFCRIFTRCRQDHQRQLAEHWGGRNPYGLTAEQIIQKAGLQFAPAQPPRRLAWEA